MPRDVPGPRPSVNRSRRRAAAAAAPIAEAFRRAFYRVGLLGDKGAAVDQPPRMAHAKIYRFSTSGSSSAACDLDDLVWLAPERRGSTSASRDPPGLPPRLSRCSGS